MDYGAAKGVLVLGKTFLGRTKKRTIPGENGVDEYIERSAHMRYHGLLADIVHGAGVSEKMLAPIIGKRNG
jgi:hypothetical protein